MVRFNSFAFVSNSSKELTRFNKNSKRLSISCLAKCVRKNSSSYKSHKLAFHPSKILKLYFYHKYIVSYFTPLLVSNSSQIHLINFSLQTLCITQIFLESFFLSLINTNDQLMLQTLKTDYA